MTDDPSLWERIAIGALGLWTGLLQWLHRRHAQDIRDVHRDMGNQMSVVHSRINERIEKADYHRAMDKLETRLDARFDGLATDLKSLRDELRTKADK